MNRAPGPSPIKIVISIAYVVCRISLMMFYVLTIVRLAQLPAWQRIFAPMAAAGRMPLTNYLMQTLIATTMFYGWGFGLWGRVGPARGSCSRSRSSSSIQVPLIDLVAPALRLRADGVGVAVSDLRPSPGRHTQRPLAHGCRRRRPAAADPEMTEGRKSRPS